MNEIKLTINNIQVSGLQGQSILDIARANGIDIPTLCHDDRVKANGACGLCLVEVEGVPKLLRACSTLATNGAVVFTKTERVIKNRKTALELLLSNHKGDCRPPCSLACPAETDCQGYVGLIANGEYEQAYKLVRDKIILPASVGRVCPRPCEDACRRKLVEEPVAVANLKQFVGDKFLDYVGQEEFLVEESGKDVGVVGGGLAGLTVAYFLRERGHAVTIYDAMPEMGGMLRYGIPEYRLPRDILKKEISAVENRGVKFLNNVRIGKDITLEELSKKHSAVVVGIGAWKSAPLGCGGEDLEGVFGGINFLLDAATQREIEVKGKKVAVVGGGNTAMDACRTALRLGADAVYNIYRRTKNEMPALQIEIDEADEEGVMFKDLTTPIEIVADGNNKVKAVRLQIMELGEPDKSGRRSPVPVLGKEETVEVELVIIAIGQKLNLHGFGELNLTKWGTIIANEQTFSTNIEGVFAVGDAVNKGPDIAVTVAGHAKRAVITIDKYLNGEPLETQNKFLVKTEKTASDFLNVEKQQRVKINHRPPAVRKNDFNEVNFGLNDKEAESEAMRCLECGCMDYFECKLVNYATEYSVQPGRFASEEKREEIRDKRDVYINRNGEKCILCGLCVRVCDEVIGASALGLVGRGFDTLVKPPFDLNLKDAGCITCGQCVTVCPTGALTEVMPIKKQVPLKETITETTCKGCDIGCKIQKGSYGNLVTRSLPFNNDEILCEKGKPKAN
jgi:formate dehydrogenase major subunit